ncbi:MAG: hypothetical protein QS748_14235 [Candidatus Endonucleobacter bathymodioli]|uniref:Uncharacterized protein n=1 Tax=Candidatus Endonucleibacter bathymodioli TaxID=539814 RepID=A0AA90NNV8_9GAMM|nr:hypothetical protein [Candidatus Endonucleobacter bathymodioli]
MSPEFIKFSHINNADCDKGPDNEHLLSGNEINNNMPLFIEDLHPHINESPHKTTWNECGTIFIQKCNLRTLMKIQSAERHLNYNMLPTLSLSNYLGKYMYDINK